MTLHLVEPGLCTLLVDGGRPRTRSLGVPVGGAADRTSLAIGNALVGNDSMTPALEISLAGPTLRADCDLACVLYGAPFGLSCGSRELQAGKTFTFPAGETLRIGGTRERLRAYLCIRGGIGGPEILGSRSALQPVRAGATLACQPGTIAARFVNIPPASSDDRRLRIVAGPQADWFEPTALHDATFTVSPASNRMGLRLQGTPLRLPARELVSEPVCPGAIQVTRDGQLIVLGVDGQTIGGYPKIAQVISADLHALGQLRPGEPVVFGEVSLTEAADLYRRQQSELRQWLDRLRLLSSF